MTNQITSVCSSKTCYDEFDWILPARDGSQFLAHSDHLINCMTQPGRTKFDQHAAELIIYNLTTDCSTEAPEVVKLLIDLCHPRSRTLNEIDRVSPMIMKLLSRFGIKYKMPHLIDICRYYFKPRWREEPLFLFGFAAYTEDLELSNRVTPLSLGFKKSEIQDSLGGPGLYHDHFIAWCNYRKSVLRLIHQNPPPPISPSHPTCRKPRTQFHSALLKSLKSSPHHLFSHSWRLQQINILRWKLHKCRQCLQEYERWLMGVMKQAEGLPNFEGLLKEILEAQMWFQGGDERFGIEEAEECVRAEDKRWK